MSLPIVAKKLRCVAVESAACAVPKDSTLVNNRTTPVINEAGLLAWECVVLNSKRFVLRSQKLVDLDL